jgi:hypothetical protein
MKNRNEGRDRKLATEYNWSVLVSAWVPMLVEAPGPIYYILSHKFKYNNLKAATHCRSTNTTEPSNTVTLSRLLSVGLLSLIVLLPSVCTELLQDLPHTGKCFIVKQPQKLQYT